MKPLALASNSFKRRNRRHSDPRERAFTVQAARHRLHRLEPLLRARGLLFVGVTRGRWSRRVAPAGVEQSRRCALALALITLVIRAAIAIIRVRFDAACRARFARHELQRDRLAAALSRAKRPNSTVCAQQRTRRRPPTQTRLPHPPQEQS